MERNCWPKVLGPSAISCRNRAKHLLAARQLPASEYLLARETCNCSKLEVSANLCSSTQLTKEVHCDEWIFTSWRNGLETSVPFYYAILLNPFFMLFTSALKNYKQLLYTENIIKTEYNKFYQSQERRIHSEASIYCTVNVQHLVRATNFQSSSINCVLLLLFGGEIIITSKF